jgi:hypothetical protein
MNENRRTFIKYMALAGGGAFVSISPTELFGEEGEKRIVSSESVNDTSLNHQQTRQILKKAYVLEIQAHLAYTKFPQKALKEDYPKKAIGVRPTQLTIKQSALQKFRPNYDLFQNLHEC